MFITKDYYSILGVLPNADNIVIDTAYKALIQRYDPDRFAGSKDEAHRKIKEINEVYRILSNPDKKKIYDKSYGTSEKKNSFYFNDEKKDQIPPYDPLKEDWRSAIKHYPDLVGLEKKLSKISWRLGYSYRAFILESGLFKERVRLAHDLEQEFLENYFGPKPEIMDFAHGLLITGNKPAVRALNKSLKVSDNSTSIEKVINQIRFKYNIQGKEKQYFNTLTDLGYKIIFKKEGLFKSDYIWEVKSPDNKKIQFKSIKELGSFTKEKQKKESHKLQEIAVKRKVENSYKSKLKKIGYQIHSGKKGWIITGSDDENIQASTLEELGSLVKDKLLNEVSRLQQISAQQKLENSYEYKLEQIGYTLQPRTDGWVLIDADNRKIRIKSLELINPFVSSIKRKMLCESILDKFGYILMEKRGKWVITNYLGDSKVFKSLEDLERYTKAISKHS